MSKNQTECKKVSPLNPKFGKEVDTVEHLTKEIAKGGGIAFFGSVFGRLASFGLHILLGRVLGSGAYGLYALGKSVIDIGQSFSSLGFNHGVVRFCAIYRGKSDNARVKGTILFALLISALFSLAITGMLFLLSGIIAEKFFHEPNLTWILRIFSLALPLYVLLGVTSSFALSYRRIDYQQGVQKIFSPFSNFVLVALAFLFGYRLTGAILAFCVSGFLSLILSLYFVWKIFPEIKSVLNPVFDEALKFVKFSLPMLFVGLSYFLALKIDRIMLGVFRKPSDVGIYSAASNIALQLTFVHGALITIFMPIISNVYNKRRFGEMETLYNVVKRWSSYGTFLLIIPIIFYPKLIMSIFGQEFIEGWIILMILPLSYIVIAVAGPTGALLQMTGKQNIEFLNGLIMVTVNVILNYFLIPIYGYIGAAVATLLSVLILNVVQLVQIRKFFGFHPFDLRHLGYLCLISAIFVIGVIINLFDIMRWRTLIFLLIAGIFLIFGIQTRTGQDEIVWKAIKQKLSRKEIQ